MTKIFIQKKIGAVKELFPITDNLKAWDYSLVEGESFYHSMTGHYAHIKLNVSKSDQSHNYIANHLTENQLPLVFAEEILKTLTFFVSYINGIKGDNTPLKFEIVESSYHPVDSRQTDYQIATFRAIVNCFDKSIKEITFAERQLIQNCKNNLKL